MQRLVVWLTGLPKMEGYLNPFARKLSQYGFVTLHLLGVPVIVGFSPSRFLDAAASPYADDRAHMAVTCEPEDHRFELSALFGNRRDASQIGKVSGLIKALGSVLHVRAEHGGDLRR